MQLTNNGLAGLRELRSATLQCVHDADDPEDRQLFIDLYWDLTSRYRMAHGDYEGAWHRIQVSAVGASAFEGMHRICRGNVEDEPIGLIASPLAVMGYVHVLSHCMVRAKKIAPPTELDLAPIKDPWDRMTGAGNPVAELLRHYHGVPFVYASLAVATIVDWVNNHRRLETAA